MAISLEARHFEPESEIKETEIRNHEAEIQAIVAELLANPELTLGEGKTAEVKRSKVNPKLCYKIITDTAEYRNNVKKEAVITDQLRNEPGPVRVPKVFFAYMAFDSDDPLKEVHVIGMETLNADNLEEIIEGKAALPQAFNAREFETGLRAFVKRMHAKNIYHRDLHSRNIMVDRITGKAYVIDFGDATEHYFEDEDPYLTIDDLGRARRLTSDEDNLNTEFIRLRHVLDVNEIRKAKNV